MKPILFCFMVKDTNMFIFFRHSSSQHGSNISYDHNGKILNIEKTARPVGTTVILKEIFSTMPVRVKEFHRNIKKEFAKLCQVLCVNYFKGCGEQHYRKAPES